MDRLIEQRGNTILVRDLNTTEILETIGAQFFSYEFNAQTVQLVDSSKASLVTTIPLSELYTDLGDPLNTEELALDYISQFSNNQLAPGSAGVLTVTGDGVDNTDPVNPVVNTAPFIEERTFISGSADSDNWVIRALGPGYAYKELRIYIANFRNALYLGGVRRLGSTYELAGPVSRGSTYFTVYTDEAGKFEIISDTLDNTFIITGTRNITPPVD